MKDFLILPEEFRLLKEFVLGSYGVVLEEGKAKYLALKLLPRLEELRLRSFSEYYSYLKLSPRCAEERRQMVSLLTNNETYFFREEAQLQAFSATVLPGVKEAKLARGERRVHIVSAGCSSGEEVYTLAMLLLESGLFTPEWEVRITGVDVDVRILERARGGAYSANSFRGSAPLNLDRYFKRRGTQLVVNDDLRGRARFVEGNLLSLESVLPEGDADIIFCRNVLIYFRDQGARAAVMNLDRALARGGFLFLGHSESLARISSGGFTPLRFPGAIVYQKKD